jgi:NitT/TauT family transport system ATP-binding protein
MIRFENVGKSFRHDGGPATPVLADLDFTVPQGEFMCVLGPSGCGKTTLLNLAAGFIAPSRGRVLFDGREIRGPGPDRGVVFQDATLFPWLDVARNVEFGLKLQGLRGRRLKETAQRHLEILGLGAHALKYPHTLSGGMRQRVAIARVLALEPKVLLMDEPFSALDANTRERLQDELLRVWTADRRTVIYVTHSVEEAAYLADRVLILGAAARGVFADMPVDQKRPRDRSSAGFLSLKDKLRRWLASQPCCIQPRIHAGGNFQ